MKKVILSILLCVGFIASISAQDQEYRNEVKKMMELSGGAVSFEQTINQMLENMQGQLMNVPAEFWIEMKTEMTKDGIDKLIEMITPIYYKYFTLEDLKQINAFYETPIGKKWGNAQPDVVKDQMTVGMEWGKEIGEKVVNKLRIKKYIQ